MKQKTMILALTASLFLLAVAGCGNKEKAEESSQPVDTETTQAPAETADTEMAAQENTQENEEPEKPGRGTYEVDGISITYYDQVRDDVTGNWRLAVIANGSDLNAYVVDFYKKFVSDDSELLGIVNLSLRTTTRVQKVMGDWIDVTVFEYQQGEEHYADKLFGGELLKEYWINTETGEIDENLED